MATIVQLATIVAVAESGSMVAAARALTYSCSTVSSHVLALERHVGTPLVNRTPDGCLLTPVGADTVELARDILALHARLATLAPSLTPLQPAGTLPARSER